MNERQMRYILEIAKEGSVTAAAQNLYISQPSLSNLLAKVETELGMRIFDRSVAPMVLTYAGEKYVEAAQSILGTMRQLRHQIDDMKDTVTGRLHIGCGPQQSPFIIPRIIPVVMERFPGVQIQLTEDHKLVLEDRLLRGMLDVIIYGGSLKSDGIESIPLDWEEMLLLAPRDYRPGTLERVEGRAYPCIDLNSLEAAPFVLMKRQHQLRVMQDFIFADHGITPNIILETGNWQTCMRMVESKIAFTILPNAQTEIDLHDIQMFSFKEDYHRQSSICYKKNAYYSKAISGFIDVVLSILPRGQAT